MSRQLVYGALVVALLGLAVGQVQGSPYIRAAYWDADYSSGWAGGGETVRDALQDAGYEVLDAAALKTWMDARLADGELSVVVFCKDIVPDTVAETQDENCTIRRYLNAGGKIVWYSDIPFYYVGHPGSTSDNWGDNGAVNVMGFNMAAGAWDSGNTVTITEDGAAWGLTATWASARPTLPDAWDNLTILAADDAGNPAAWAAHYVPGDTFRGFVRIFDVGGEPASMEDLMAVAEYCVALPAATSPAPGNDAIDVPRDAALGWMSGDFAATHDVYFGTSLDDVSAATRANPLGVLVSEGQVDSSFNPAGVLEFGQTYYWRIDEVNAAPDNTIFTGAVWSFTVEPVAYPVANVSVTSNAVSDAGSEPERTIDGSGLNADDQHSIKATDMWLGAAPSGATYLQYEFDRVYKLHEMLVWNYNVQFEAILGFGAKDVTVEYSTDGAEWTTFGEVEFSKGTSTADYVANTTVDFDGVAAQYVRLTINAGWGVMPQFGLSEVRFLYIPAHAREAQPTVGTTDVDPDVLLAWRAGRDAATHEIYLSSDKDAVADGSALFDTISDNSYAPAGIEFGTTYFWKVNEVNDADAISSWEGDLWSFVTREFTTVEDFESYDDEDNRIYETWIDGYGVSENGSQVGYLESPFAERATVNSGAQAMPLFYDNTDGATVSEAQRDFGAQNWTVNGADTLSLYFQGQPPVFVERADGSILMGAGGADIWGTSDEFRYVYKRLSGDGSITAKVESIGNTDGWAKGGVMIRESLQASSAHGSTVVTPLSGVSFQRRPSTGVESTSDTEGGLAAPYWVRITRSGNAFTAERSADGVAWESVTATAAPQEIPMAGEVYIGLAVTSHVSGVLTSAEFSNVSTTGNVTGSWQAEAIGTAQSGNEAAPLYLVVEDTAGHTAVVMHPDPEATLIGTWRQWKIPYSELAGVNMAAVKAVGIGVGDRNSASAGGVGQIFVDDLGFGRPVPSADITVPSDSLQAVPNDADWPLGEPPAAAIDDDVNTKFLHFKGASETTGIRVTPSVGATVVTELAFTTANDSPERDPVAFELYGSNDGIDGPYTLIASGEIIDFAQEVEWPRFTKNETPVSFENDTAYAHYQVLFTAIRDAGSANSMQIAEVELIGDVQ